MSRPGPPPPPPPPPSWQVQPFLAPAPQFVPSRPPRTPATTHLLLAGAVGVVVGLMMYLGRVPIPRVLGAAVVGALALFVLLRAMEAIRPEWPTGVYGRSTTIAGIQRWRLGGFDAATTRQPGFSTDLRRRLRGISDAILERHRLVPDSAGAVTLLGESTHSLLYPPPSPDTAGRSELHPPSREQLAAAMDRLIELSAPPRKGSP